MRRAWLWTVLWATFIFATSCTVVKSKQLVHSVTNAASGHISESQFQDFWRHWWWLFVKGYHVLEFVILTCLLFSALRHKVSHSRSAILAFVLSALYAASDEFHQTFVPERGGKVTDVMIDLIGVAIGVAASLLLARRMQLVQQRATLDVDPSQVVEA